MEGDPYPKCVHLFYFAEERLLEEKKGFDMRRSDRGEGRKRTKRQDDCVYLNDAKRKSARGGTTPAFGNKDLIEQWTAGSRVT